MSNSKYLIGTRGSLLAVTQCTLLKDEIESKTTIKTTFRIIGAADAAANLLCEFKIAEKKEDKQTSIRKGKVILVKLVANSIFSGFSTNPGARRLTNPGMKICATSVKESKIKNKILKTLFANLLD